MTTCSSEQRTEAEYEVLVRAIVALTGGEIHTKMTRQELFSGNMVGVAAYRDMWVEYVPSWRRAYSYLQWRLQLATAVVGDQLLDKSGNPC